MHLQSISIPLLSLLTLFSSWTMTDTSNSNINSIGYGDPLPDAPALSARGEHQVGVQTLQLVNPNQLDILNATTESVPKYDRPLTVEVWYPASLMEGEKEAITYHDFLGAAHNPDRPLIPFTFEGKAARDAAPQKLAKAFPLVILSHGYTGSRFLMTYLTENLASKGYVVAAIAHTESTYQDASGFHSTLLNRPLDILFVLEKIKALAAPEGDHFLAGLADANNTAIIGYSMGGYGVVNVGGAGFNPGMVDYFSTLSKGSRAMEVRAVGAEAMQTTPEAIKAVVALAPWGMNHQAWNAEGLAAMKKPLFLIGGSEDDISGYETGVKAIYEGTVNSKRYLLTYLNARHNVAPNPPPPAALEPGLHIDEYLRFADSVWDQRRINNINQHFITAFLGIHLKGKTEYQKYLDLERSANAGPWEGFLPRTAVGLELRGSE